MLHMCSPQQAKETSRNPFISDDRQTFGWLMVTTVTLFLHFGGLESLAAAELPKEAKMRAGRPSLCGYSAQFADWMVTQ